MIEDIYPLSPLQYGMLFDSLSRSGPDINLRQFIYSVSGALDLAAFEKAWQQVVERHTILRTSFIWEEVSEPHQIVHSEVEIPIQTTDLRSLSRHDQEDSIQAYLRRDKEQGINLSEPPLFRLAIFRLLDSEWQVVWTGHHLAFDGWSTPPLIAEIATCYWAYCQGTIPRLPVAPPYRDYIQWLQAQDQQEPEVAWRQMLAGFQSPTLLDVVEREGKDSDYSQKLFSMSAARTKVLQEWARRERLTLNSILQGTFALLLARYSGNSDVVFGATVSVRPDSLPDVERMIGLFINTVPVRVQLRRQDRVLPWLHRLQTEQVTARRHAWVSLTDIMRWSEVPTSVPLFESLLVVENYSHDVSTANSSGVKASSELSLRLLREIHIPPYPLTVAVSPGRELTFQISYDRTRFGSRTVERMTSHWQCLLSSLVSGSNARIEDLSMLSASEREQVVHGWNGTGRDYGEERWVYEWVEEQAAAMPEALAVVHEGEHLSYGELNARANQLGHYLRELGVGPEVRVGICLERSLEMVIALLGVLKAGGAYVPLDPGYPGERLQYMVKDAEVLLVLSHKGVEEEVLGGMEGRRVSVEGEWEEIGRRSGKNLEKQVYGENVAYVIYTSGSTGQPKGAMNTHWGIRNRLEWMQEEYGLRRGERVLQKTSFSFDVSVWELLWPLQRGAVLVLARAGGQQDAGYLQEVMEEEEISTVHFVPSMLEAFLEWGEGRRCRSLRRVISSGEELKGGVVEQFYRVMGGGEKGREGEERGRAVLHNLYGPTEAAVDVTYHECGEVESRSVAIGRPIGNLRMYVLDEWGAVVPVGVGGEVYIGGAGVGRGYWRRAELTAEKFVPDGFSEVGGERLYRTGDKGRWLESGELEFLGRVDEQVKVRGYRIELGEIEAVLREMEGVKQAVVVVRGEKGSEKQLVGYVVLNKDEEQGNKRQTWKAEIQESLKKRLPEYMIPLLVQLENIPLTVNGKLDYRALPPPSGSGTRANDRPVGPRDGLEARLLRIWREVLGNSHLSVKDDFFEIGGNSLKALVLVARLRELVGKPLPVRTVFQNRTIEQQAGFLLYDTKWISETSIVPLQPKGFRLPFFCVHPAGGLVNSYIDLARHLGMDQPFYGIQAYGSESGQAQFTSVHEMAAQYIKDLKAQQPKGPYQLGGWSLGCIIAYEMAQQLTEAGEQVILLALLDGACNPDPIDFFAEGWEHEVDSWIQGYLAEHRELDLGEYSAEFEAKARLLQLDELYGLYLEAGKSINRIPAHIKTEDFRRYLRTYGVNVRVGLSYKAKPYSGKVTFFSAGREMDDTWMTDGWGRLAEGKVDFHVIPGNHDNFVSEPHVQVLAQKLRACMEEAAASSGPRSGEGAQLVKQS